MSEPFVAQSEVLIGLSPNLANHMDDARHEELHALATTYFKGVLSELDKADAVSRLPEELNRWEQWNSGIITPLRQATPTPFIKKPDERFTQSDLSVILRVPFMNAGVTTPLSVRIGLTLLADERKRINDAGIDVRDVKIIAARNEGIKSVYVTQPHVKELADRVGYELPVLERKARFSRRTDKRPYATLAKFIIASEQNYEHVVSSALGSEVTVTLGHSSRTNWDDRASDLARAEIIDPTVHKNYDYRADATRYGCLLYRWSALKGVIDTLDEVELKHAADNELEQGRAIELLQQASTEQALKITQREKVTDELFTIIVAADEFKALVQA